jgi:hypothetical protein
VYVKRPFGGPRIRGALFGPLRPSRGHLQPPLGLLQRRPNHFPLVDNDFQIYLRLLVEENHNSRPRQRSRGALPVFRSAALDLSLAHDTNRRGAGGGKPKEKVLPPDTGYEFLWRLYSYWRFQERRAGVYLECRAISLAGDVPSGLGWAFPCRCASSLAGVEAGVRWRW